MSSFRPSQDTSDDSSDDDWRDPHLEQKASRNTRPSSVFDDVSTVISGRGNIPSSASSVPEHAASTAAFTGNPDDYWLLPPNCSVLDILGQKRFRTGEIARTTGVYLTYNESYHQIDFWGDSAAIEQAKRQLNLIANRLAEDDPSPARTTKKWSRPERQLTEKERRREDRRQQRILEDKKYLGEPTEKQPYQSVYFVPQGSVGIESIIGINESFLNEIRVDCKTFIYFDLPTRTFRLCADDEENIKAASSRLRNWHLRVGRNPEPSSANLMQQPRTPLNITYAPIPLNFVLSQYEIPEKDEILRAKQRILKAEINKPSRRTDLISLIEEEHETEETSEIVQTMDKRNAELIHAMLCRGLEGLRLKDWDIRMKIRYGTICLIDFPKYDGRVFSIEDVSEKLFRKSKFKSALAPCISKTETSLDSLFRYLAEKGQEFSDNPRTSFVITADQYPESISAEDRRRRENRMRGDMWRTQIKTTFNDKGERGLWSTVTKCTDLVSVSSYNAEGTYSWDLRLQYARTFPHNDINAPHEKFSHNLRLSDSGRLIMVPIKDYHPERVVQKTEWRYFWKGFIIEIVREELWDMVRIKRDDRDLPLNFSDVEPHRVQFKVSMYKEAWLDRFSQNLRLKVGEAPNWTLHDFLGTKEDNAESIVLHAKRFGEILTREVPKHYGQQYESLV
ncbi:hypothetical protein BY458DRAFT_515758 [Sporodiniella umbellata]|nr:hypothetical protein BY458DRAFT_515758 [Sporodiniella umbellata]